MSHLLLPVFLYAIVTGNGWNSTFGRIFQEIQLLGVTAGFPREPEVQFDLLLKRKYLFNFLGRRNVKKTLTSQSAPPQETWKLEAGIETNKSTMSQWARQAGKPKESITAFLVCPGLTPNLNPMPETAKPCS